LIIDPVPEPSIASAGDLASDWWRWWDEVVSHAQPPPGDERPPEPAFVPPDFGAARFPRLHRVVTARWREAYGWHSRRKMTGLRVMHRAGGPGPHEGTVVREVAQGLGRPVPPFDLDLIVLPVADDEVREVSPTRYLVPEPVYTGPDWPDRLRPIITRLIEET
jgi:hypothetical protein